MTAPSGGGPSRLRVGGFALLGIALVAGIIGLATWTLGGDDDETPVAAPPPGADASPTPGEPAPGEQPGTGEQPGAGEPGAEPGEGGVPVPSFGPGQPGRPGAPAPDGTNGAGPGGPGAPGGTDGTGPGGTGGLAPDRTGRTGGGEVRSAAVRAPLRVYNNSNIRGLAEEGAADFRAAGWTVTEVGNYSAGIIPTSTVYYRPGTDEKAAADTLAREFGLRSEPRFDGIEDASPGVIVILTKDYQRR